MTVDPHADASAPRRVSDNPEAGRYELHLGGELSGVVEYRRVDDVLIVPHVEVLPELRGRGYSAPFLDDVLDDVRRRGLRVRPLCSYARAHMLARPELHELLEHRQAGDARP